MLWPAAAWTSDTDEYLLDRSVDERLDADLAILEMGSRAGIECSFLTCVHVSTTCVCVTDTHRQQLTSPKPQTASYQSISAIACPTDPSLLSANQGGGYPA